MRRYSQIIVAFLLFAGYTVWWAIANLKHDTTQMANFSDAYFVLALTGAIFGIAAARKWGGLKSLFGRAMIFLSLGLLFQVFGQVYNTTYARFISPDGLYPGVGDIGFFGAIIMYLLGVYWLGKAIRARIGLANWWGKLISFAIPAALLATSYFLFLHDYQYDFHRPLTVFLDFGYPFGDALYVSAALLTVILSRKVLGGVMQKRVLIVLAALFVQYAADFSFSYTNSRGTHITGDWIDYLYLCAYLVMTLALIGLGKGYYQISAPKAQTAAAAGPPPEPPQPPADPPQLENEPEQPVSPPPQPPVDSPQTSTPAPESPEPSVAPAPPVSPATPPESPAPTPPPAPPVNPSQGTGV